MPMDSKKEKESERKEAHRDFQCYCLPRTRDIEEDHQIVNTNKQQARETGTEKEQA